MGRQKYIFVGFLRTCRTTIFALLCMFVCLLPVTVMADCETGDLDNALVNPNGTISELTYSSSDLLNYMNTASGGYKPTDANSPTLDMYIADGDWSVQFETGTVSGYSACAGNSKKTSYSWPFNSTWAGCICSLDKSKWVFLKKLVPSDGSTSALSSTNHERWLAENEFCRKNCAYECALAIKEDTSSIRTTLFNAASSCPIVAIDPGDRPECSSWDAGAGHWVSDCGSHEVCVNDACVSTCGTGAYWSDNVNGCVCENSAHVWEDGHGCRPECNGIQIYDWNVPGCVDPATWNCSNGIQEQNADDYYHKTEGVLSEYLPTIISDVNELSPEIISGDEELNDAIIDAELLKSNDLEIVNCQSSTQCNLASQDSQHLRQYVNGTKWWARFGATTINGYAVCGAKSWSGLGGEKVGVLPSVYSGCACILDVKENIEEQRYVVVGNKSSAYSDWVGANNNCRQTCPYYCAKTVAENKSFRDTLFNGVCPVTETENPTLCGGVAGLVYDESVGYCHTPCAESSGYFWSGNACEYVCAPDEEDYTDGYGCHEKCNEDDGYFYGENGCEYVCLDDEYSIYDSDTGYCKKDCQNGSVWSWDEWDCVSDGEWNCVNGSVENADAYSPIELIIPDITTNELLYSENNPNGIIQCISPTECNLCSAVAANGKSENTAEYQTYLNDLKYYSSVWTVTFGETIIGGYAICESGGNQYYQRDDFLTTPIVSTYDGCSCSLDGKNILSLGQLRNGSGWANQNNWCRQNCPMACAAAVANNTDGFRDKLFNGTCPTPGVPDRPINIESSSCDSEPIITPPAIVCDENTDFPFTITTNDTSSFSFQVSASGTFCIDWGDRIETKQKNNTDLVSFSHYWYDGTKPRTIRIGGRADGYNTTTTEKAPEQSAVIFGKWPENGTTNTYDKIVGISGNLSAVFGTLGAGDSTATQPRFWRTFYGCTNIESNLPQNIFASLYGSPVDHMFYATFMNCPNLTNIPTNDGYFIGNNFFGNVSGTPGDFMFDGTFSQCGSLIGTIPPYLFSNIHGMANDLFPGTFYGCSGLTGTIPAELFATIYGAPTRRLFAATFSGCSGLSGPIPENLLCHDRTDTTNCIAGVAGQFAFRRMFVDAFESNMDYMNFVPPKLFETISTNEYGDDFMLNIFDGSNVSTLCPQNYYQYITGFENYWNGRVSCVPCETGHTDGPGATSAEQCFDNTLVECPENTYEYYTGVVVPKKLCDFCPDIYMHSQIDDNDSINKCYAIVQYDSNGGENINSVKVYYNANSPAKYTLDDERLPEIERAGYIFNGWYYDGELVDENTEFTSDVTLHASWSREDGTEFECDSNKWWHFGEYDEDKICLMSESNKPDKPRVVFKIGREKYYAPLTQNANININEMSNMKLRVKIGNKIYNAHDKSVGY